MIMNAPSAFRGIVAVLQVLASCEHLWLPQTGYNHVCGSAVSFVIEEAVEST